MRDIIARAVEDVKKILRKCFGEGVDARERSWFFAEEIVLGGVVGMPL